MFTSVKANSDCMFFQRKKDTVQYLYDYPKISSPNESFFNSLDSHYYGIATYFYVHVCTIVRISKMIFLRISLSRVFLTANEKMKIDFLVEFEHQYFMYI